MRINDYLIMKGWGGALKNIAQKNYDKIFGRLQKISGVTYNKNDDIPEEFLNQLGI